MRPPQQVGEAGHADALRESSATFPADEVVWGVAVRPGFDELDDPFYHRGLTQHAFLEGSDSVSLCGFRPPLSGPRHRRRARLSLPSADVNPMCGTCARRVVAPRSRVSVPVQPGRPAIAVPVTAELPIRPIPVPAGVAPRALVPGIAAAGPIASAPRPPVGAVDDGRPLQAGSAPSTNGSGHIPPAPSQPPRPPTPGAAASGPARPSPWVRRVSDGPNAGSQPGGLLERGILPDPGD